jgi:hypothetical protein
VCEVLCRHICTDAPFTSPLEPSWTGFTVEEAELLKGNVCDVFPRVPRDGFDAIVIYFLF